MNLTRDGKIVGQATGFGRMEVWSWRDLEWNEPHQAIVEVCPKCSEPFRAFMRGLVVKSEVWQWICEWFGKRAKTAVICSECKEIVGWE